MSDNHNGEDDDTQDEDPLDDIFVDGDQMDRELVASILDPYMAIDSEDGELYPKEAYGDLDSKEQIQIVLTAERAKALQGLADSASLGPSAISNLGGINENTVKPGVRDLADDGQIADTDGGYEVRSPHLNQIENDLIASDE